MITLPVGEFKTHFSDVIKQVEDGREYVISYGRGKRKVAALIPYASFKKRKTSERRIGVLKGIATYRLSPSFKMTEEEFLLS